MEIWEKLQPVWSIHPNSYLERIRCFYSDILQAMLDLFLPKNYCT